MVTCCAWMAFGPFVNAQDFEPPGEPGSLDAIAVSGSQVNLGWSASTDNVGVTGYQVERSQGAGSTSYTQIATPGGTSYVDTGLAAGTVYNYRLRATDQAGNLGPYSNVATATTLNAPSGLVAAYGFNEGGGTTVTDLSGNGITGTIFGAAWTTSGKYGKALAFNGDSSFVDLGNPSALQLTGSMTWSAWVNAAANPVDDGQIVAKSDGPSGWQFKTSPDTGPHTFGVAVSGGAGGNTQRYSVAPRSLNVWYHVAGVYNAAAGTLDIYINGVLNNGVLVGTIPASQIDSPVNANIGRRTGGFYFNGIIDEVRIYDRALSIAEIQTDMNTPVGGAPPPDTQPPTAPGSLAATAVAGNQINLSWTAATDDVGVTEYLVERQAPGSSSFVQVGASTGTTFPDAGLTPSTSYSYRVRATDAAGNFSPYSNASTATTLAPDSRLANNTLTVPAVPAVYGYQVVDTLGGLTFNRPVAVAQQPGETNRLFIVEQAGNIYVITNLAAPAKTLFMNLTSRVRYVNNEEGLLGMAFHPGWETNRNFFLFYTTDVTTSQGTGRHDRLARFEIDPANSSAGLPLSEFPLISQWDQDWNHNGGDLHFGPDGYLYVSTGDEGGGGDTYDNSRFINKDFFSAILRIDVDRKFGSLEPNAHPAVHTDPQGQAYYAIPADNPFIGATSFNGSPIDPNTVRTEFWAVGLRNPWRMSFDPATGLLYCADVGQNAREEVNIIEGGRDYGWKYKEGFIDHAGGIPANTVQESDLTPPIIDYPRATSASTAIPGGHAQGTSITGGVVYNGDRFSQLKGHYVFGDFGSSRIFALRYDAETGQVQDFQQLTSATTPAAFGIDPSNGDALIARLGGTVSRLVYSSDPVTGDPLPLLLSQTGAFSDLATLATQPGIVPYDLNVPFWSDHAHKSRWFSIPDVNDTMTFSAAGNWQFPVGTVWIKHFDLELTNGVPTSRRRLETRFLVKNDDGVHGFTYKWNATQTDADLVTEAGVNEILDIRNPDGSALRSQTWRYPSRSECLQCHTPQGGYALGFTTAQLNHAHDYGQGVVNQITALSNMGYFDSPAPDPATLFALAPAAEESVSLELRARSYLQANCAACHQPGGTAQGNWDARFETALESAGLVNGPLVNNGGDPANRVIAPGDPGHSMILTRISQRGPGQMPPLASTDLDEEGIALVTAWINSLGTVEPKEPIVTWNPPASIVYGPALGAAQLNATADVPGTFLYDPPAGTILGAGIAQTLSVTFTPDDQVNYLVVNDSVPLHVSPAPLTITAENKTKIYGAANPVLTATYSGLVNDETPGDLDDPVILSTSATSESPVGGYPITASGAADTNYTITHANGTLTVDPAPLIITAENKSKVEGQPNPPLTASYNSFVNGETPSSLDNPVILATTASLDSAPGPYPITASGAADANYQISFVAGTLTVEANARFVPLELGEGNRVTLQVAGHPSREYRVQVSPDLESWEDLTVITTDASGAGTFIESSDPPPGSRYFRILWP